MMCGAAGWLGWMLAVAGWIAVMVVWDRCRVRVAKAIAETALARGAKIDRTVPIDRLHRSTRDGRPPLDPTG